MELLEKIKGHLFRPRRNVGGEQGPDFYDRVFLENPLQKQHYTASPYYFLWSVIVDRLRRSGRRAVLEVGCGAGQLARAIADARIVEQYLGFDFSEARINQARRNCPGFRFEIADAFATDLFRTFAYDVVISTEFLEHVNRDLAVLDHIRTGTYFLGTVPNFPYVSHVRHFQSCDEVAARYASRFDDFSVAEFVANEKGKRFFLLEGLRSG